jgi:ankyrin repeat protein
MRTAVVAIAVLTSTVGIGLGEVPIVDAARAGDSAAVLALLAQGADVNAAEVDQTTALHWAVHHDDARLVERLIDAGANAAIRNSYSATPMSIAAAIANVAVIEMLLDAGADPDSMNETGQTALMVVARNTNVDAARLLLEHGADPNAAERQKRQTALMWAAAQSQAPMVELLIANGADVNARSTVNARPRQVSSEPRAGYQAAGGLTPLLYAAREGCLQCVRHLVEGGADPNLADPEGVTPLIMAVWNTHFDAGAYLLEEGADPNKWDWWGRTPLYLAVDYNTIPHGGRSDRPSLDDTTPFELTRLLLEGGASPNMQLKILPPFRQVGADRGVDGMLTTGATPLIRAAKDFDAPSIELLLRYGALPNLPNRAGISPTMAAAGLGSTDADTRGWYHTSDVQLRSMASLELLLDAGGEVNASGGRRGQTALHGAAFWGWNDVVEYLVDRGADLTATDPNGMTPLDSAMGRAGGNSRGGQRIDVFPETGRLIEELGGLPGTPPALGLEQR